MIKKLEVGKRYICRNGYITRPLSLDTQSGRYFEPGRSASESCWSSWSPYGFSEDNETSNTDIIAEYVESSGSLQTPGTVTITGNDTNHTDVLLQTVLTAANLIRDGKTQEAEIILRRAYTDFK